MSLKFPMFTPVFERDEYQQSANSKQICFESCATEPSAAQNVIDMNNGRYGKGVVGMVLPLSSRVRVKEFRQLDGKKEYEATFLQFGVDFEEFDDCTGNYSTAIVLLDDGKVKNVPVEAITFLNSNKG